MGLCARNLATISSLLPTYDLERRAFANRVIRASGAYLRFMSGRSDLPLAQLRGLSDGFETYMDNLPPLDGTREGDLKWCAAFAAQNDKFLLGFNVPDVFSKICPQTSQNIEIKRPILIDNGKRAPNPRVCFGQDLTGYLYDKMTGAARFHILLFGSDLQGPVRDRMAQFSRHALGPKGFFTRYGAGALFNIVLVLKAQPWEKDNLLKGNDFASLRQHATVVYDDRSPDEDSAYCYGINHARGAIVAVRPDLWVGTSCWPEEGSILAEYFGGFLVEKQAQGESTSHVVKMSKAKMR